MKRGIVFIFLLLFVSSFIFSCSSSSENKSSGGIRHIYEESEKNAAEVTGIKIAGNYIELAKENGGGTPLHYNIGASAQPSSAKNKALLYTSSDPELAEVSDDGIVTIKDLGTFSITIQSASREDIWQKVDFYVRENIRTDLDIVNNPLSFFGSYSISQYGINKSPDTNVGGSFSINADKKSINNQLSASLLFNGLDIPIDLSIEDVAGMSYDETAKAVFSYLDGKIKDSKTVIIRLKAEEHSKLVENHIVKDGDILYLTIKKEYDLVTGQSHVDTHPVQVTKIEVEDEHRMDRRTDTYKMLAPVIYPVNASNKAVVYSTSDEQTVKVSPTGVITPLKEGAAEITVTSVSDREVTSTTKVHITDSTVRVNEIVFDNIDNQIYIGHPVTVNAAALPENATYRDITYYSKNPSVATVNSATGVVIPRHKGTVEIAAVSDKGSFEKSVILNVGVYQPSEPVKAIVNIPSKLDISLESDRKIELNGKAVPTYADNVTLLYKADESGCVSVDENGIVTALKEGTGIVTVYSAKYPEIKKDVIIAVREKEEKVYVTEINVNQAPSTLYIGHTHHTFIPEIIPADANIDNELTVSADDNSIVKIEKIGSEYKVEPLREGSVIITFQTANGVTNEVSLNVGKVMNVKGYYAIDRVEYTLADKTEIFTPQKDNLQGEFAINLLEDKYLVQGRLQYIPANPFISYTFNNWRYIYENREIMLDTDDKYYNQTKEMLSAQNIKVTSANTIEYTYTQDSFKAVIHLTKVNDEVKEILDRTMYMTPVDMAKDPHSAEGYYEMTWFYGNSFNTAMLERYPAIYSTSKSEMPQSSSIGTKYHKECPDKTAWYDWSACYGGGGGENSSVTYYKGAFTVKVDGTADEAQVSSIMKVQTQGHQNYNLQSWAKYMHGSFNPLTIYQNQAHSGNIVNNSLKATIKTYKSNEGSKDAAIAYTWQNDNIMQYEVFFNLNFEYRFMYRAKKVSDRYIDLPTDKFVNGDVSDRTPPEVPDLAQIVPVEDFKGLVTAIE